MGWPTDSQKAWHQSMMIPNVLKAANPRRDVQTEGGTYSHTPGKGLGSESNPRGLGCIVHGLRLEWAFQVHVRELAHPVARPTRSPFVIGAEAG
jgi:hypothetical protein